MKFKRSETCEDIEIFCIVDGKYTCRINIDGKQNPVTILDLSCTFEVKHDSPFPLIWPEF